MPMRYYTTKPRGALTTRKYLYECDHPLYSQCTLVRHGELGLAIVQKRYNRKLKIFWYGPIYSWLADEVQKQEGFAPYFAKNSAKCTDGLYPTVEIRRLMWALKMKPLRKDWYDSQLLQLL